MLANIALRALLKSTAGVVRESGGVRAALSANPWTCSSSVTAAAGRVSCVAGGFAVQPPVRYYSRPPRKKPPIASQYSHLSPTMLKMDYAAVPLAQTTDDLVRRIISLEFANHTDKFQIIREELVAKVQKNKYDRTSVEVKVAILTAKIRNYQEHLNKHHKDKANKRWMLMAIDRRKKLLKNLRLVRYEDFQSVCEKLGIKYTFPPEYHRRLTRRWRVKKALCKLVYKEVQKQKAKQMQLMKENSADAQQNKTVSDKKTVNYNN